MPKALRDLSNVYKKPCIDIFYNIPPLVFVSLFLTCSIYFLFTKIDARDLWWHLACGRYFFENGLYPPTGTFTFSPVNAATPNAKTWLGDLFLYVISRFFGEEFGLQFFGMVMICIPVIIFIILSENRYNTWTFFGAIFIVIGTYQQNLLRNSIFAMFFTPLIVWLWYMGSKKKSVKPLILYPFIFLLWSHIHGYVIVGICIASFFLIGECLDQLINKSKRNFRFLLVFLLILCISWKIVHSVWQFSPIQIVSQLASVFTHEETTPQEIKKPAETEINALQQGGNIQTAIPPSLIKLSQIKNQVKWFFRPFLRGGDAEIIHEFASPFDMIVVTSAKAIFFLSIVYLIYLILAMIYDPKGLKISFVLPSLASIYLGLGYCRSMAFPFQIAVPFMAVHIPALAEKIQLSNHHFTRMIKYTAPWFIFAIYLIIIATCYPSYLSHPIYAVGLKTFAIRLNDILFIHKGTCLAFFYAFLTLYMCMVFWKDKEHGHNRTFLFFVSILSGTFFCYICVRWFNVSFYQFPGRFFAAFLIVPFYVTGMWMVSQPTREKFFIRPGQILLWTLPLLVCVQFFLACHYYAHEKKFYEVTGISNREPGIGRNTIFDNTLPDYIFKNFPDENLFNSYDIGGYLLWKWYGKKKVFIDSRSINYANDFIYNYWHHHSLKYVEQFNINKALIDISSSTDFAYAWMGLNWTPTHYNYSSVLLQKGLSPPSIESSYGIIPEYLGDPEEINHIPLYDVMNLCTFISNSLRYMLLFGRLQDAILWSERIQPMLDTFPQVPQLSDIEKRKSLMANLENHFGRINHPAISYLCMQIAKINDPFEIALLYGETHLKLNQTEKATATYLLAAQTKPDDIILQKRIADLLFEKDLIEPAITQYQKVIEKNPEVLDAYMKLGFLYAKKRDYAQSESYLYTLLEKAPMNQNIYLNLGLVLAANGKHSKAIAIYEKGLSLFPENSQIKKEIERIKGIKYED